MKTTARPTALLPLVLLCLLLAAAPAAGEPETAAPAAGDPETASPAAAPAPAAGLGPPTTLAAVGAGSLLLATERPGLYLPAPLLDTDVKIEVTGLVARARVEQRFWNPTAEWVEGLYAFPLPEDAAVDTLRVVIGDRVIEGQVQEKEEARRTYETAKREGRKASLLEQRRPNLFTTSVAPLGPDEVVQVRIELQQEVRYRVDADGVGRFTLRFPTVVAPRYTPGPGPAVAAAAAGGIGGVARAALAAAGVTPARPGAEPLPAMHHVPGAPNPLSLAVEIEAGVPLAKIESPSHPLRSQRLGPDRHRVELAAEVVTADRDFVLAWTPAAGRAPRAALFTQEVDGDTYALLMVLPPARREADRVRLPREAVFVLDTSGSMGGASIREAKAALAAALGRLAADDWFNVIRFSSQTSSLYQASVPATPENLEAARRWVAGLEADGGTEMLPALQLALAGGASPGMRGNGVRQVVFITDGQVGNEEALFAYLAAHLGESRLFPVGIGSAPNSYFMARAAEAGRGTFTYIAGPTEVEEKIGALCEQLTSPVLADLEVTWDDPAAEGWPERLGDLYAGEPLVVAARLIREGGGVAVAARGAFDPWEVRLPPAEARPGTGLDKLWARRKIAALLRQGHGREEPAEVRRQVLEVALAHHLVSPFTSLVAVDVTPTAPAGTVPLPRPVPLALPAGWGGFEPPGSLPQGATPSDLLLRIGLLLLLAGALVLAAGPGRRRAHRPAARGGAR